MSVALGVTTYNRPEYCFKSLRSIAKNLAPVIDRLYVYNDGSSEKHHGSYARALRPVEQMFTDRKATYFDSPLNSGVAVAKNALITAAMDDGADWVIIAEDDIVPILPGAVTEYVRLCEHTGNHHLSFAHHGPANANGPVAADDSLAWYPHSIGAWCIYSRECIETVGLLDEQFRNAWEHVEYELRIIRAGLMPGADAHRFPDARYSRQWLQEIPGSIDRSSIRPQVDWSTNIRNGLLYWKTNKPETYDMLFGVGKPLHGYANSLIGAQ